MTKVNDQQIIDSAKSSQTMLEAARKVGLHPSAFIPRAKRLGVYIPNQSGRGIPESNLERQNREISLQEILDGKYPYYSTSSLHKRLIRHGIKQQKCEKCGMDDQSISYALDHIDGDNTNHILVNLRILCPNCHSKTPTFSGRNKRTIKRPTPDNKFIDLILEGQPIREILNRLELTPNGVNYKRVERLQKIVEYIRKKYAQVM